MVARFHRGSWWYLLVKHQKGLHWGLPKGHPEKGETPHQAALREVREETGLNVQIVEGFKRRVRYDLRPGVRKSVTYFLALSHTETFSLPEEEIRHAVWLEVEDARRLVSHRNIARVIAEAHAWLLAKVPRGELAP